MRKLLLLGILLLGCTGVRPIQVRAKSCRGIGVDGGTPSVAIWKDYSTKKCYLTYLQIVDGWTVLDFSETSCSPCNNRATGN